MLLTSSGCAEAPLPQRQLRSDDCLRGLELSRLQAQIRRCNAVVAAFPDQPGPLNDRSLLHVLAGDDRAACSDVARARRLLAGLPPGNESKALGDELQLRGSSCAAPGQTALPATNAPSTPAP
ncbi:MAG: hypothetical protein VKI83_11220 [Synechococcaceae cyanobacterium]|nr:hypothetical protein [Synechococcaceae cyanobacterium]